MTSNCPIVLIVGLSPFTTFLKGGIKNNAMITNNPHQFVKFKSANAIKLTAIAKIKNGQSMTKAKISMFIDCNRVG